MKIKRINTAFLLLALAGMTLTGCSNEDLANVTPQEEGAGNVSFSIVEKDYEPADNTPKSRAAIEETKPEIQDLGDGLMAEVSLVPDTTHRATAPKTRAINTPTHYTIQAFQGGVKKGELKGTFNGSTFTPDASQPKSISLPHGTYDFVCFNDGVTANGTQLTVNRSAAGTARFDVQRDVVINQDPKQQVKFTMKHAGAAVTLWAAFADFNVETKIQNIHKVDDWGNVVYKYEFMNPAEKCKFKLETDASTIPETMVYDLTTHSSTYPVMGQISKSVEVDGNYQPLGWATPGQTVAIGGYTMSSDYWLPSTDCSKLKVTFTSGEIYGSSLVGKSIQVPENKLVEANKAYTILIRFYVTDQYVYSDGTFGPRAQNSGKTPIAVIIDPYGRLAVGLHDIKVGGNDMLQWSSSTSQTSGGPTTNYSELFLSIGSSSTSSPSASISSGMNPYMGSPYNGSVPNIRDILLMGNVVGKMLEHGNLFSQYRASSFNFLIPSGAATTGFTPVPSSINFPTMDMTRFNNAFTNVNGEAPSGTYWTSIECKDGTEYKQATITISGGKYHLGLKSKTETAKIRPFIRY